MNVQVLMAVMDNTDHTILQKSNIQTDAIIINQCKKFDYEEFKFNDNLIKFISFPERGVGLSRNNALMRSTGTIVLFADEDEILVDNYADIIISEFNNNPKADMIMFNVPSLNKNNPTYMIEKTSRIRRFNSLRYGATKIAVRSNRIKQTNSYFSLLFGGGTKYAAGEDSIFIYDSIRKGLKVYASPQIVGYVSQKKSTWFKGYDDKYFRDMGAFFYSLSPKLSVLLIAQFVIRKRAFKSDKTRLSLVRLMLSGMREFRQKDNHES